MPLSKGLEPLNNGASASVTTAFIASVFYHVYVNVNGGDEYDGKVSDGRGRRSHERIHGIAM